MRRKNAGGKPFVPDGMNLGPGILKKASGGGGNDSHAKPAVRKPGGGTGVVIETEAGECQSVLGGSLRKRLLPAAVQDEGKPGKLGQTDAVRKAVRLRKVTRIPCRQQRFSPDREGGQIFSFKRGADDGKLQQVRMKLFQELVGVGFKQLKADGGILFMKALHPFRKQAAAHRGDDAEAERSRHAVPAVDELLSGHIRQLQHGNGPLIQKPSGFGQNDFSGAPFKQKAAKFLLQLLHLCAQGRLGQIQFSGGPGNGAFLYHCDKFVKLLQLHDEFSPFYERAGQPDASAAKSCRGRLFFDRHSVIVSIKYMRKIWKPYQYHNFPISKSMIR